ncbi:transposase [Tateyamaria sp.]|uniref:transposase n=1 Tax=Tateyamaria sp. TaxID=1929288 RepID=UPI003B21D0B1
MVHPDGAGSEDDLRLDFDPRVRLEFHGSKLSSDGGLLLYRELDEALGLFDKTVRFVRDTRKGKNGVHSLMGMLRQSVFGRLAGLCCTNQLRDSLYESSVVAGGYEQLVPYEVQDQELAFVQHGAKAARFAINLV